MPDPTAHKRQLREQLRRRRNALVTGEQQAAARSAADRALALPGWNEASRIALYLAADGELDPGPLARRCREQQKTLYLPVIQEDNSLRFAPWHQEDELQVNRYGIPEPPGSTRCEADALDIIILPLVGWDRQGNRLGMGGGFYDRSLAGTTGPLLVGLAHDCQEAQGLPRESWDVSLDFVVTGTALVQCRETLR